MTSRRLRVKNKHAASVQITAEQILREANERQIEHVAPVRIVFWLLFPLSHISHRNTPNTRKTLRCTVAKLMNLGHCLNIDMHM